MPKPWFSNPEPLPPGSHIAIIGGGIAGITTSIHLEKNGYKTTIIDKNSTLLSEASGNPAAILDPFLSASETIEKEFYLCAYNYALKFYSSLGCNIFNPSKLVKIPANDKEAIRYKKIANSYGNDLLFLKDKNLILPNSGYILPPEIKKIEMEDDRLIMNQNVAHLDQISDQRWTLYNKQNSPFLTADAVILCNAGSISHFDQTSHIQLDKVAGQVSYVSAEYSENKILCSDGYLTPVVNTEKGNANICGATFEKENENLSIENANDENLRKSPYNFTDPQIIGERRATRAMSNDHLPLCGPAPDLDHYLTSYQGLHHGPNHKKFDNAKYHKNLFIISGLGSRGFLTGPLLAKYISALITGKDLPFDENICHALHPARFIIRSLSKK